MDSRRFIARMDREGGISMSTDPTQRPDNTNTKPANESKNPTSSSSLNDPQINAVARIIFDVAGRTETLTRSTKSEVEVTARLDRKLLARGHLGITGGSPRKHRG